MKSLRILSYNIHKGVSLFGSFTLPLLKEAIHQTQADLVLLQEVQGENLKIRNLPSGAEMERQFEYLADTLWHHYAYAKNAIYSDSHHGNAILSKYPILAERNFDLTVNAFEFRGLQYAKILIPKLDRTLDIYNTHLNLFHSGRMKQSRKIVHLIRNFTPPDKPFILAGDFNDWQKKLSPYFQAELGLQEAFLTLENNHAKTFPTLYPILPLDRIYYSGLSIKSSKVLKEASWVSLSDHLPILSEFKMY
jgi:endonuclease/exonuclease/phosphatase family metal-dependent hydrolase